MTTATTSVVAPPSAILAKQDVKKPTVLLHAIGDSHTAAYVMLALIVGGAATCAYFSSSTWQGALYTALTLVAITEMIVFSSAYGSNFINVMRNPEGETSVVLAGVMLVLTTSIRFLYIIFFFLAPIFGESTSPTVQFLQKGLLYIVSSWWIMTIVVPPVISTVHEMRYGAGNMRLVPKPVPTGKSSVLPLQNNGIALKTKFVFILPVYNEELQLLITGLESVLTQEYPQDCVEIHCAFDDDKFSELYCGVVDYFLGQGTSDRRDLPTSVLHTTAAGALMYFHRWPHGGKRSAQASTWKFIEKQGLKEPQNTIMILTDSDNFMLSQALNNLAVLFYEQPNKIALAGYMSCMTSNDPYNIMKILQDTEYISNEINRVFELMLGSVNCLPGGFTAIRYTAIAQVAPHYFERDLPGESITQYHQFVLGEDRYLTHLVHKKFPAYTIGFSPLVRCKTDPPATLLAFIKQRRRWLLGAVANEAYMLSTPMIWRKTPLLLLYKTIQTSWRSAAFSQILVAASAIIGMTGEDPAYRQTYLISMLIPFGIAWLASAYAGCAVKHYKTLVMWPFLIIAQNFMQIMIDVYTIITWQVKSWGGPRCSTVVVQPDTQQEQVVEIVQTSDNIQQVEVAEVRVVVVEEQQQNQNEHPTLQQLVAIEAGMPGCTPSSSEEGTSVLFTKPSGIESADNAITRKSHQALLLSAIRQVERESSRIDVSLAA